MTSVTPQERAPGRPGGQRKREPARPTREPPGRAGVPTPVVLSGSRAGGLAQRPVDTAMPSAGPLVDTFGRVHDDLRISVTDRCNLRCVYCMPEEGLTFLPRAELLDFEEIVRAAAVAHRLGVRSVRITGGEPLVRRDIVDLVRMLAAVGFADLSLTTNGMGLATLARPLADAGLQRVNVSCDSLQADRYARLRRRGDLHRVLAGMAAAEEAGLAPMKVNVVLLPGENDDEILAFADFARRTGRIVRFIEYMPLDADGAWQPDRVVEGARVVAEISARWPLEEVPGSKVDHAPAERFRFVDGGGEIGVVSSVTQPFCGTCNRLRLTADGSLRNCLFSDDELSVRDVMRSGGSDEDLATVFRRSVWGKAAGHGINAPGFVPPVRSMSMIGG